MREKKNTNLSIQNIVSHKRLGGLLHRVENQSEGWGAIAEGEEFLD